MLNPLPAIRTYASGAPLRAVAGWPGWAGMEKKTRMQAPRPGVGLTPADLHAEYAGGGRAAESGPCGCGHIQRGAQCGCSAELTRRGRGGPSPEARRGGGTGAAVGILLGGVTGGTGFSG